MPKNKFQFQKGYCLPKFLASALSLNRSFGISINASLKMKHKLQHVMKKTDDRLLLEGFVELDDVYWGGKRRGDKRGLSAPGKTPFLAAAISHAASHRRKDADRSNIYKCFAKALDKRNRP